VLLLGFSPAHAERVTKMFPLQGVMPRAMRGAPDELTRVFARSFNAEIAKTSLADAADLIGCDVVSKTCIESIADKVGARKLVFGKIEKRTFGVAVRLTLWDSSKGEKQSVYKIHGDSTESLADALQKTLDSGEEEDTKQETTEITEKPRANPIDNGGPKDESSEGGITTTTWALIIGGGAATVSGAGFLFAANSLKANILEAPTKTHADIVHLQSLENAARLRTEIGVGLMLAGGAVAGVGIVRAVLQHRSPTERPLVDVAPEKGGASVFLNLRWK
jgi:hypothetical protein